ncbi:gamma-glutamylcyclotransferase family protein [Pinisolibacter aquiterrae]|uniref:gamma-glutamylcyclotransferase family protein n=1 Tax=Pinisolibacter aquiterrae TaxID=2815579 RepID=UPI001C3C5446|nr:gamma-glutamylcyclotransferase family protein [Pinisolibacter aquiterrae]MBV5266518.1 gamma-glutamylcyclotransferase [Pinisolibacter aquiterrae]MCC8234599.1 gamma-glutamylcyclotransferase [Pinisolibacter aquiterrae]
MASFVYFAYGSNLLAARLGARCPSAVRLGPAIAEDHRVAYDVRAADGSVKLGLRPVLGDVAHGLLWRIDEADRDGLARAEGTNYREITDFPVRLADGRREAVASWLPHRPPEPGHPWHWYRALALAGALEAALPPEAVARLAAVAFARDPDPDRPSYVAAREALRLAGRLDRLDDA